MTEQNRAEQELVEDLANLEHEQWMTWAKHLASAETLSPERVERWVKLFKPYSELTELEKDDDRDWANKALDKLVKDGWRHIGKPA